MIVTLDLDGTLLDFPKVLAERLTAHTGEEFLPKDIIHYNYKRFLPLETHEFVDKLLANPEFYLRTPVIAGAQEFVKNLASFCDVYVITSRDPSLALATSVQVKGLFPEIKDVILAYNKCAMAQELRARLHLDDDPKWVVGMAHWGVNSACYSQPYNALLPTDGKVIHRIEDYSQFLALAAAVYEDPVGGDFNTNQLLGDK